MRERFKLFIGPGRKVWIIGGCALAESVRAGCNECHLKERRFMEQKMGPLPDHKVELFSMFQSVAVDLFSLIEYHGKVNKRQVGKGWGVIESSSSAQLLQQCMWNSWTRTQVSSWLYKDLCV